MLAVPALSVLRLGTIDYGIIAVNVNGVPTAVRALTRKARKLRCFVNDRGSTELDSLFLRPPIRIVRCWMR